MTVREYAKSRGISYQAVYQLIKKRDTDNELEGHIKKVAGVLDMDEYAVEWADKKRSNFRQNVMVQETNAHVEELETEIKRLRDRIDALIDRNNMLTSLVLEAQQSRETLIAQKVEAETKLALIEQKEKEAAPPEEPPKKSFWSKLFG